jgi:hypothetical protein
LTTDYSFQFQITVHRPYGQDGQMYGFVTKTPCNSVVILLKTRSFLKVLKVNADALVPRYDLFPLTCYIL